MTSKTQKFESIVAKTSRQIAIFHQIIPSDLEKQNSLKAELEKCEIFYDEHKQRLEKLRKYEIIDESPKELELEMNRMIYKINILEKNQRTKQDEENAKLRELLKRHLIHINDFIEKHDAGHHTSSFTVIDVALHEKTAIEKLLEESKI